MANLIKTSYGLGEKCTLEEFNEKYRKERDTPSVVVIDDELAFYNDYTCLSGFSGTCLCLMHPMKSWIAFNPKTGDHYTGRERKMIQYKKKENVSASFIKEHISIGIDYIKNMNINPCNVVYKRVSFSNPTYFDEFRKLNFSDYVVYMEYYVLGTLVKRYVNAREEIYKIMDKADRYSEAVVIMRGSRSENYRELYIFAREESEYMKELEDKEIKATKKLMSLGIKERVARKLSEYRDLDFSSIVEKELDFSTQFNMPLKNILYKDKNDIYFVSDRYFEPNIIEGWAQDKNVYHCKRILQKY